MPSFWLIGLCLSPLVIGFILMMLPPRLWQSLMPRLDQSDTSMGILAVGLITLGLALSTLYGHSLWEGWRSTTWQPIPGEIIEAHIVETRSPRSTNPYWEPRLRYSYIVNGAEYEGSRLSFDQEKTIDREWLQTRLTHEWLPGTAVTVWVNPSNPDKAVLKQGVNSWLAVFVSVGLVLIGVGVHLLRLAWDGWQEQHSPKTNPKKSKKKLRSTGDGNTRSGKRKKMAKGKLSYHD